MLFKQLINESAGILEHFATAPFIVAVRSGTIKRERYMQFLNDLFHVVWHFCPTMAVGASRCNDDYLAVRYALYEHIEEEKGHELWVLEDCEAIGGREFADKVRTGLPSAEMQALNAFNYFAVERHHGVTAFAMVFALELISQKLASRVGDGIAKALGLEGTAGIKFLTSHGSLDEEHLAELSSILNGITDPKVCNAISNAVSVNLKQFKMILS